MEITQTVFSRGFDRLSVEDRANAFDEYLSNAEGLRHCGDMITVLNGQVWVLVNEYDFDELTATFLLPIEY